jgi:hypothetical protein
MSTLEERVNADLATLADLAEAATKAKESASALVKVHRSLSNFVTTANGLSDEDKLAVVASIGEGLTELVGLVESASKMSDSLNTMTGQDREAGDAVAKRLSSAIESGYLEGDVRERAEQVVSAWKESTPRGGRKIGGGGGEAKSDLPFPVKVKCESHDWSATQSTTKNSLRWAAILHHEKEHGSKPERGSETHKGLTEAIESVVSGKAESGAAQGGGYIVTKA